MAEEDGRLPPAPPTENGRRPGYKVEELLNIRQVLGASPERAPLDVTDTIAVQNFKGGVGKSNVTPHTAHSFPVQGYPALLLHRSVSRRLGKDGLRTWKFWGML